MQKIGYHYRKIIEKSYLWKYSYPLDKLSALWTTRSWNVNYSSRCLDWLVGWLVVFNIPSTARSFRDGTPIYCPLRRMWSSINTPFRPGFEPRAVAWQSITLPLRYASSRMFGSRAVKQRLQLECFSKVYTFRFSFQNIVYTVKQEHNHWGDFLQVFLATLSWLFSLK